MALSTQIYSADTLPQSLTWQAQSFLRCEWPFLFTGTNRLLARPFGGPDTTYVVQADGEVLFSYAEVLQVTAARDGEQVQVLGLSNVFTFPPYRNEGHASAIMRGVDEVINGSDAELAILFCEKELGAILRSARLAAGPGWLDSGAGHRAPHDGPRWTSPGSAAGRLAGSRAGSPGRALVSAHCGSWLGGDSQRIVRLLHHDGRVDSRLAGDRSGHLSRRQRQGHRARSGRRLSLNWRQGRSTIRGPQEAAHPAGFPGGPS